MLMTEEEAETILLGSSKAPRVYSSVEYVRIPFGGIPLKEIERAAVIEALNMAHGVQKDAAALLHISPRIINFKIKKLGIEWHRPQRW